MTDSSGRGVPTEREADGASPETGAGGRFRTEREGTEGAPRRIDPRRRPPTEREGTEGAARRIDSRRRPPTEREGTEGRGRPGPDPRLGNEWVPLPPSLPRDFEYVADIEVESGEAKLYRVRSRRSGRQLLLKIYNNKIHLRREVLDRIYRQIDSAHVVKLLGFGEVKETGDWCEVQEYIEGGDLFTLIDDGSSKRGPSHGGLPREQLDVVVRELNDAISAFHRAGLAHHDIKPHNILIRKREPLDLVLADFGLSIAADRTVYLSRRAGTIAYDSPESLGAGQGGPKRDYWAFGMTIAQLAGRRHPFALAGTDQLLSDAAIRDHLWAHRPIDLSAVTDPRVRLLCEGLTRYDEDNRWGSEQVESWLHGDSPEVVPDAAPDGGWAPAVGLSFAGRECATRQQLAATMAADWRAAVAVLGAEGARREFIDQVSATFGGDRLAQMEDAWAAAPPGVDRAISDLIVALDPTDPPIVVCGLRVDPENLPRLAGDVASGDAAATRAVGALYAQHCFDSYARVPGHEHLRELDTRWRSAIDAFQGHARAARAAGAVVQIPEAQVHAQLLGMIVDHEFARKIVSDSARPRRSAAFRQDWYRAMGSARGRDPAASLAAALLGDEAERLTHEQDAARHQAAQARLHTNVQSIRAWLRWPIVANLVTGIGLTVIHVRRGWIVEAALDDGDLDAWVEPVLAQASGSWVWLAMGVGAWIARRMVAGTTDPFALRGAQAVSAVTTVSFPLLVPLGLRQAFRSRRMRTGSAPSTMRQWAVGSSLVAALVVVGLWANRAFDLFQPVYRAWPEGVRSWYSRNWPAALDAQRLTEHAEVLSAMGFVVFALGLGGSWLSYTQPADPAVRLAQRVAIGAGVAIGLAGLPIAATGVAFLLYGAFIVGLVLFAAWIGIMILDDNC